MNKPTIAYNGFTRFLITEIHIHVRMYACLSIFSTAGTGVGWRCRLFLGTVGCCAH